MSKKMNYSQFLKDRELEVKKEKTEVLTISGILPLGQITVKPLTDKNNDLFISKFAYKVTDDSGSETRNVVYQIDADINYKDDTMVLPNTRFAPDEIFFGLLATEANRLKVWDGVVEKGTKRNFVKIHY